MECDTNIGTINRSINNNYVTYSETNSRQNIDVTTGTNYAPLLTTH